MLKTTNLKLYRKFLILAILLGGLSLASHSSAAPPPCCSSCLDTYTACVTTCNNGQIKDWMIPACEAACYDTYDWCENHCNPVC
jgi:hypothetical protein